MAKGLLTEAEVARALECSVELLRHWRREGRGPRSIRVWDGTGYPVDELLDFMESQDVVPIFPRPRAVSFQKVSALP